MSSPSLSNVRTSFSLQKHLIASEDKLLSLLQEAK